MRIALQDAYARRSVRPREPQRGHPGAARAALHPAGDLPSWRWSGSGSTCWADRASSGIERLPLRGGQGAWRRPVVEALGALLRLAVFLAGHQQRRESSRRGACSDRASLIGGGRQRGPVDRQFIRADSWPAAWRRAPRPVIPAVVPSLRTPAGQPHFAAKHPRPPAGRSSGDNAAAARCQQRTNVRGGAGR